jgi:hypothetical protein
MAELDPFELVPKAFTRIQLRGIGRQALEMEALRRPVREKLPDGMTAVDRRAIPNDDHLAGHLAQQVLEKPDHVVSVDSTVLAAEVQLALWRDGTDRREMVAGPPLPHDRGLANRGVGADDTRQGIKARFVYEEDGLLLLLRPLLRAGQICSRQCAMAASSRCRACRAGFCGLQRIRLHRRPTWVG